MSKWREFESDILRRLDIINEYKQLGLKTASDTPRAGGWLPCFAMGREDSNASAAIYLGDGPGLGTYHDSGGKSADGGNLGFFRFAAEYGPYTDWRDARKHYAKQTGVKSPRGDKDDRHPLDRIEWASWNLRMVRMWCEKKGGISVDAVVAAGGRMCRYPKGASQQNYCIAFPVYPTGDTRFEPSSYIIVDHRDMPIPLAPGKEPVGKMVLGTGSGLVGKSGIEAIEDAETVWKVEGLTDMLAATTQWLELPVGQRGKLAIVTNANGCKDVPEKCLSTFGGTETWIIHDCDKAGEAGAEMWCRALQPIAATLKHVRLPGEVSESNGYDLRDYFREGNTLADVQKLGRKTKARVEDAAADPIKAHQQILEALNMDVVGQVEDSSQIIIYSRDLRKLYRIKDIGKFGVPDAFLALGDVVENVIWDMKDDPPVGYYRIADVRKAIAREAAHLVLGGQGKYLGSGVWEVDNDGCHKTVIVSAREAAVLNGQWVKTTTPRAAGRVLDFGGKPWVDLDACKSMLDEAKTQAFAEDALEDLEELLAKWNWVNGDSPEFLSGLVLATWVQTVWPIRPMVGICGSTNCGKTLLMDKVAALYGDLAWRDDGTTAAALRQTVRHHGTICMIDEFEHNRSREEMLDMLRSSSRGATKTKGTAHQQSVSYGLKHIVWTSAIELGLTRSADKNRFLVFDLNTFVGRATFPNAEELRKLGMRLLAVSLTRYRDAKARSERLKAVDVPGVSGRLAEIASVPVAMLAAARGFSREDEAALFVRLAGGLAEAAGEVVRDEVDLLRSMAGADLMLEKGGRATVFTAILPYGREGGSDSPDAQDAAMRSGFKLVNKHGGQGRFLFVAPDLVVQKGVLRGTRFEGRGIDLRKVLMRLEDAKRAQHRLGPTRESGIEIPWETVEKHLVNGVDEDESPEQAESSPPTDDLIDPWAEPSPSERGAFF